MYRSTTTEGYLDFVALRVFDINDPLVESRTVPRLRAWLSHLAGELDVHQLFLCRLH